MASLALARSFPFIELIFPFFSYCSSGSLASTTFHELVISGDSDRFSLASSPTVGRVNIFEYFAIMTKLESFAIMHGSVISFVS